ncbi:hypothetical protein HPP92_006420 [Vanilla planifolia]|uniref:Protein LURP-one-related 8 n=1 Tax=Vanilla planifolia TaxID=51239 RepID=A0A835RPA1_VANPL|nr:hypothetical protein HPP92_006420 [Vanilla planifolia]
MTKRVHPNAAALESPKAALSIAVPPPEEAAPELMTVWRKSLLFNCNGFTVFDAKGNLVFRVDKYPKSSNRAEIVLMGAAGNPLLTIRRKKLTLAEHWQIFDREDTANPRFSVRRHMNFLQAKCLAHLTPSPCGGDAGGSYDVEGSYSQRCCVVCDERRQPMAEIKRKESVGGVAFGLDVFRLVVQPGFDAAIAMAIVILLEEMFGSKSSII